MKRFALALLMLGTALPAQALDLTAMTDAEREAFRAEVRSYLLENPEVLMEAIGVLESRQAEAAAAQDVTLAQTYKDAIQNDGYSFVGGNPAGDITLVEFMDYKCGYCKRAFAEVEQLLESDGNIRFVVKEFPILGEQSTLSAKFAVAVQQLHGDSVYKPVHDALMTLRGDVTPDSLTRLAQGFGLDPAPIFARLDSPEVTAVLTANAALGQTLAISGTPTFVLEDQMIRGYVPLDQLQTLVAQVRAD